MTYNVLASKLLQSNRYLYRNDNAEILEWDYRKGRLLQELIDSDAEVCVGVACICGWGVCICSITSGNKPEVLYGPSNVSPVTLVVWMSGDK